MFSTLVGAVASSLARSFKIDGQTMDAANTAFRGKYNSIAKMAKQSIMEYPVILSTGLADDTKTAVKIVRHTELTYAMFLALAAGMNPTIEKGGTISSHMTQFGTENTDLKSILTETPDNVRISIEGIYNNNKSNSEIKYKKASDYFATEANIPIVHGAGDGVGGITGIGKVNSQSIKDNVDSSSFIHNNNVDIFKKALNKGLPTAITIKLYAGEHVVDVTIAVKAVPHFMSQEEVDGLFEAILEDTRPLFRFLQLTTGEISFFRDYIFQLDRIKRDKRLYALIGNTPIYRQLMKRKNDNLMSKLLNLQEHMRELLKGSPKYLPNITIICTMDEVSRALKTPPKKIISDPKIIYKIINSLMLLGFTIYDPMAELVYYYYSSFDKPYIYRIDQLKNDKDKIDEAMLELVKVMQGTIR